MGLFLLREDFFFFLFELWESTLPKYTYNKYGVTGHIGFPHDFTTFPHLAYLGT